MKCRLFLNVAIRDCATIFELLASEDESSCSCTIVYGLNLAVFDLIEYDGVGASVGFCDIIATHQVSLAFSSAIAELLISLNNKI